MLLQISFVLMGCAQKTVKKGVPFGFDTVFDGSNVVQQETLKAKGMRLAKDRDYDEAIKVFTQHIEEEPEQSFGFNALAVCYKNTGDQSNAMKNFERALEFAETPEEKAKVLANIGNLYFSADKHQVALGYYKEAASEFEAHPLYLVLIARTFAVLGDYERARKVLSSLESSEINLEKFEPAEDKGLGYYLMAYCYASLNEEDKTVTYLEKAIRSNSKFQERLRKDLEDEKSLFFSLSEDPRITKLVSKSPRS